MRRQPTDVRMTGFAARATVEEALAWVDESARSLAGEPVPLADAHRRVLAEDIVAGIDVPGFDRSAMDGYALRAEETIGAGDDNPLPFTLVGQSLPGSPFAGAIQPGEAVRIMTGAPVPAGATAVVPAEYAEERSDTVEMTTTVAEGKHIGRRGEDIAAGSTILTIGRCLRPQDVGVLASLGIATAPVIGQPRVRLIVTGNELVQPGEPCGAHQIYEANSHLLRGLIARDGGLLESIRHVPDDRDSIRTAMTEPGADVLLISGGSSVGAEDHAPMLLAEVGELAIHGVAMRPSSPAGLGRIDECLAFLLPGNPVSCLCAYDFFAGRAIRILGGRDGDWPHLRQTARLRRKIVSAIGRVDYCRVRLVDAANADGVTEVEPLAISGASILSSTVRADGFVIIPAAAEGYAPGTEVEVLRYAGHTAKR